MFKKTERVILFPGYTAHNDYLPIEAFKDMAETAAETGFTHVDLGSAMISRSRYQLDNNGKYFDGYDFYPEYTATFPDFFKFHCPDALKKVISADYVEQNMEELRKRSAILSKFGLKGSIIGASPQFLPEEIYQEHPSWRGARCDMPFRCRRPYFAPCVDNEEVLELYREASKHIGEAAPVIDTVIFLSVDSGTGLCWFDKLYPGANGPQACAHRSMDERVAGFTEALSHGLKVNNPDPLIHLTYIPSWTFSGHLLPHPGVKSSKKIFFARTPQDKPVTHENPLGMLASLDAAAKGQADVLVVNLEQPQIVFKSGGIYPTLMKNFLEKPISGPTERIMFLKELATDLGLEENNRNDLIDAWQHLYRAIDDTSHGRLFYNSIFLYGCMSVRWLTRPLLPLPEKISDEDKMYYHEHVFNSLDDEEKQYDLLDLHGTRNPFLGRNACEADRSIICFESVIKTLNDAIASLDKALKNTASSKAVAYCTDMRRRVKTLRCFTINLQNICAFQGILDRALDGYSKNANSELLEEVMRKEIDNIQELIGLLEEGGAPLIPLAKKAEDENTFLFGPELVSQLKKKISLMMKSWHDSQILFDNKTRFNT
jgi:hypothetical protein